MLAKSILVGATVVWVSSSQPINAPVPPERFFLTCAGTMRTAGDPGSEITANGLIDLARMRVIGFGVGGGPILVMTASLIGFGSVGRAQGGDTIEGSIDRATGRVRIVVKSASDPAHEVIAMDLNCKSATPMS